MVVSEVMTENPRTADVDSTVRDVMRQLQELDIRHLPIVERGELVGMVSDRDLRAVTLIPEHGDDAWAELQERLDGPITDIMSTDVVSVNPETDIAEVITLMIEEKVGAVPVVDDASGDLIGIVSYVDLLRAMEDLI